MADFYTFSGNVYDSSAAGTTTFALTSSDGNPIRYLQRSHIHVYLSSDNGDTWVEQSRPAAWDFDAAATSIVLVTGITAGQWVRVLRITPIDARYVDFEDGTLLTAGQLDQGEDFSRFCDQEQRDELLQKIPVKRFCGPDEVAHAVSFFVSPLSGFITGEVLDMNGGFQMD